MQNRFLYTLCLSLALSDLILINASFYFSQYLLQVLDMEVILQHRTQHLLNLNLIWFFCTNMFRLYNKDGIKNLEQIFRLTWKSISLHLVLFVMYTSLLQDQIIPAKFVIMFYAICGINFLLSRFLCTVVEARLGSRFKTRRLVAVMG